MGAEGKKENSFILQAGVLAMAGIIVRIIGMLYRSPLTAIIGDEGNGYYSYAYNIYANILLIFLQHPLRHIQGYGSEAGPKRVS